MNELKQVTQTIKVPPEAGREGFIHALRNILKYPRVQSININSKGEVSLVRYMREEDPEQQIEMDFESVTAYGIIRNTDLREAPVRTTHGALAIASLLQCAALDHLCPVAFVIGSKSGLWGWYERTTGERLIETFDELFGFPLVVDRGVPDNVLVLCACYARGGTIIDTQRAYKMTIPEELPPPLNLLEAPAVPV